MEESIARLKETTAALQHQSESIFTTLQHHSEGYSCKIESSEHVTLLGETPLNLESSVDVPSERLQRNSTREIDELLSK
ncbi:hypothetical protein Nepgr_000879 [Nepenthes gracilis]|uniref:Uncharacterized protein n=1 Tax=Nepenthes gracilis TaxID=150966 RepID=A0AAD3P259_NEPGR|nr:hypothetical protein Nepgr_000879 [Nepenthes gracilis]